VAGRTIKKAFDLTDGKTSLDLKWQSGETLPDFDRAPVVAARVAGRGFEWATGEARCPNCGTRVPAVAEPAREDERNVSGNTIGNMLLTSEAAPLLMMLGNVSIDTESDMEMTCPVCGESFLARLNSRMGEVIAYVDDDCISIRCEGGKTVYFLPNGTVLASERQMRGTPAAEASEFCELPHYIGSSKEAKDWLCWALGIRAEDRPSGNEVDMLDLALRYRFKGYGEGFIAEMKACMAQPGVKKEVLNGLFALPRNRTDEKALLKLFEGGKLPDKPSVKKAAAARPVALAIIARTTLGAICGNDPNLATTLLSSTRLDAAWASALLDRKGQLSRLVSLAASEEKPAYLMQRLLATDSKTLALGVSLFDGLKLEPYDELKGYRLARKNNGLAEIIKRPKLVALYAKRDEGISISYGDSSSLQGEYDGYRFALPRHTGRFASAGATLKNCLGDGYEKSVALGNTLIFLVSKGGNLVGAVEVSPQRRGVVQMYAKANRPITPTEDLGIAIACWARDKGISLSGCNYG